ncbi:Galactose oxidase [Pleurostoma richardsiae]|uniref:Galactose oxidase n=1 Tax=Pleurostoma richardsiae TaxID=41990 RepID=A0AA38RM22_9PEZI|nr:Galactose oxidase [Pleurostoma richardsiae]
MVNAAVPGSLLGVVPAAARRAILTLLVVFAAAASATSLPYLPTTVLLSSQDTGDVAYIFSPSGSSVDLLALNVSSTLEASSLSTSTLTSPLPFINESQSTWSFTPSLSSNGSIIVYAGDCSSGSDFAVWSYTPANSSATGGAGSWTKHSATLDDSTDGLSIGPSFLGDSLSFTSVLAPNMSSAIIYSYGGMCPWSNYSASSWQEAATYSNQMVKLTSSQEAYSIEPISSNGPPIAEAGFTFTPLSPSISNRSGTVTQQLNSVLLGGHTQEAFINMSTAAVWSLPEETWSFITISNPDTTNTELTKAKKQVTRSLPTTVDSRSGHTAVLNEDGNALVVFGGWVGDISQAASPQLAVLEIDETLGEWKWSIPTTQPSGSGIYGHGAALLPGNIMMVYGGYSISDSTSKAKRQASSGNSQMFLNITSMSWSSDYANPSSTSASGGGSRSGGSSTTSSSSSRQIGLGVGLSLGLAGLGALLFLAYWLLRRHRRQRAARDETVRALAQDATHFLHGGAGDDDEMAERDGGMGAGGWGRAPWYTGGHDPYLRGQQHQQQQHSLGYESLRGSRSVPSLYSADPALGGYLPPPLGVLRKPAPKTARGLYQPTSVVSPYESRMGQGASSGGIHPIYEDDEEDITAAYAAGGAAGAEADNDAASDPFATPTGTRSAYFPPPPSRPSSRTPSPEAKQRPPSQDHEVREWISDLDIVSTRIQQQPHHGGGAGRHSRSSQTRSPGPSAAVAAEDEGRTDSTLSESNRSVLSFIQGAAAGAAGAASRSGSVRSHRPSNSFGNSSQAEAARLGSSSGNSSNSGNTYTTAKSIPALQAEGPGLLMGGRPRYDPETAGADGAAEDDDLVAPGSPSKTKPPPRRNWIGSLKRVFSSAGAGGADGSSSESPSSSRTGSPTRGGAAGGGSSDYEPRLAHLGSALLQRRRQGREAWEAGAGESSSGQAAGSEGAEEDEDWDIERAVEQRLVQVMFTVPKERLRVVNAEVERDEEAASGAVGDPEKEWSEDRPQPESAETAGASSEEPRTPTLARAEAVKLGRPRSRVQMMVDELEGRGRSE